MVASAPQVIIVHRGAQCLSPALQVINAQVEYSLFYFNAYKICVIFCGEHVAQLAQKPLGGFYSHDQVLRCLCITAS